MSWKYREQSIKQFPVYDPNETLHEKEQRLRRSMNIIRNEIRYLMKQTAQMEEEDRRLGWHHPAVQAIQARYNLANNKIEHLGNEWHRLKFELENMYDPNHGWY